jgi:hypothetical protein
MLRVDTERRFLSNFKIAIWRCRTYQFLYLSDHFEAIIPVFQPSNIPEFTEYHQFLTKSIVVLTLAPLPGRLPAPPSVGTGAGRQGRGACPVEYVSLLHRVKATDTGRGISKVHLF